MYFNFSKHLKNELKYQGILVKELSARTGISLATLECYLGNRRTIPSAEKALKIARALNVSIEYLITGEETNKQKILFKHCKEAKELINLIFKLSPEQCKAITNMIKSVLSGR